MLAIKIKYNLIIIKIIDYLMFENLFIIFDIPLACILIILSFFGLWFIKNIYNVFLSLITGIFLIIFISSTMLTQQINLGEFLVIGIFFIFTILFLIFNIKNDKDSVIEISEKNRLKTFATVMMFILSFVVIGFNFYKIDTSKTKFLNEQVIVKTDIKSKNLKIEQDYEIIHRENISLLNQNRIFQKLTHVIMFYVCMVIVIYFFNKGDENEG